MRGIWVTFIAMCAVLPGGCIPPSYDRASDVAPPPGVSRDYPGQDRYDPRDDDRQRVDSVPAPPAAPPAWVARPVTPDARVVVQSSYVVRPGDTLRSIGNMTGAGPDAIARANGLGPPFTVRAGDRLTIPGGRYHLVHSGETGIAIARAYGVPWGDIVAANDLIEPYVLRTGMRLAIPGTRPMSLAERAAAFKLDVGDIVSGGEPALADNARPARPVTRPTRTLPSTAAVAAPTALRGGFSWPLDGRIVGRFGPGASGERNNGIKIAVPVATPIHAAADGVVAYAGDEIAVLGGLVIIRHGDGWASVYGHASKLLVQRGQSVRRGDVIALSGETGIADRPELHFELRKGRNPVNPLSQLPAR